MSGGSFFTFNFVTEWNWADLNRLKKTFQKVNKSLNQLWIPTEAIIRRFRLCAQEALFIHFKFSVLHHRSQSTEIQDVIKESHLGELNQLVARRHTIEDAVTIKVMQVFQMSTQDQY